MSAATTCEVCGRQQATTEIAEHPDDGLCWARRFYGGHDAGELLNALRAARVERDTLAAEVARRGELLAAERERYVLLQGTLESERRASGERSVAHMEEAAQLSAEVARLSLELSCVEERCDWEPTVAPKWDGNGDGREPSDRVKDLVDALRASQAEAARLTKLLDGLAENAERGSQAVLEAAMVAIYDDWRTRMTTGLARSASGGGGPRLHRRARRTT